MRDETIPGTKWAFDDAVANAFDDMLARSIPAYLTMRDLTKSLAISTSRSLDDFHEIVDLGCSRGTALVPLVRAPERLNAHFTGIDVSAPMLKAARGEFRNEMREGRVSIFDHDLRVSTPRGEPLSGVTLAVLTLQFTPIEYRQRIIADIYRATMPGGALLLVEKVLGASAELHEVFDAEYLAMKSAHGYTDEQIARKKASLEGVLVSLSASMYDSILRTTGFRVVDTYWRWLNFAAWIAVK